VRAEWAGFLHEVFSGGGGGISVGDGEEGVAAPVVLDVGCGPSICNVISASRVSDKIYLCDILESNRAEVERFRADDDGAHSFPRYFDFVAALEGTKEDLQLRTRNAIKGIYYCDVTSTTDGIFGAADGEVVPAADVIVASLVFDVVALTKDAFAAAVANVKRHLKRGGLMVVQGSLGESVYTVGSAVFPVLNVNEDDVREVFREKGFTVVRFEVCEKVSHHYYAVFREGT